MYFLVSQILGKVSARVAFGPNGYGEVRLTCDTPERPELLFSFETTVVRRLALSQEIEEFVIRLAVSQAHKIGRRQPGIVTSVSLDLTIRPWIGDLLTQAYGGATLGHSRRSPVRHKPTASTVAERRTDRVRSRRIQAALSILRRTGDIERAIVDMTLFGIPNHILLRVIACTGSRRKL